MSRTCGAAVGILDQERPGRTPHAQPGIDEVGKSDRHQTRLFLENDAKRSTALPCASAVLGFVNLGEQLCLKERQAISTRKQIESVSSSDAQHIAAAWVV